MSQDNAIGIKEYEQAIAALKHSVPADIINSYKPSGNYVKSSLWKIIAFGLPISVVIIFFSYVGMGLLFKLAAWIGSGGNPNDRLFHFISTAFRGMVFFFYLLLLPILTGEGIAVVTGMIGRKFLCRNVKILRTKSAINSILGYIIFYLVFLKLIDPFLHGPSFDQMPLGLSIMMFGIFIFHAIIGTLSATIRGGRVIVGSPYCEKCEKYYKNIQSENMPIELAGPIIETLKKGDLQPFVVNNVEKGSRVWFESFISKCPLCNIADYKLKIVLAYMKGLTDCRRNIWLETMIPSSLGVKILKAIEEVSKGRPQTGTQESKKETLRKQSKDNTVEVKCSKCSKDFNWIEAYIQQDTPNSSAYNPPGHREFRPRVFCPHCGFLVAEWDIDKEKDRNQWKWAGQNENMNAGKQLPPSPIGFWKRSIPMAMRVPMVGEQLDLSKLAEAVSIEKFFESAFSGDVATLKSQISAGVNVNTKNAKGETAAMLAAMNGETEILKVLIAAGVIVNDQNVLGKHTPLILAALKGHVQTVEALLAAGADPNLRNQFGKTVEEAANDSGHTNIVNILRNFRAPLKPPHASEESGSKNIIINPEKEQHENLICYKCGSSEFNYDRHWKEYTCIKCGWIHNPSVSISTKIKFKVK